MELSEKVNFLSFLNLLDNFTENSTKIKRKPKIQPENSAKRQPYRKLN